MGENKDLNYILAEKKNRVANCLIDTFTVFAVTTIIMKVLSFINLFSLLARKDSPQLVKMGTVFIIVYFIYYLFLEYRYKQTLGKKITNTKVIHCKNKDAGFILIFGRTLLRFVPFDFISYLFGTSQGIHDICSRTLLVKSNGKEISTE